MAALGYAVIQPNYRGSEGYGKDFKNRGFHQVGKSMQTDLYDAAIWASALGIGFDNRICFVGASFGGYASIRAAIDQPNLIKCAVSMAGFYDVQALLESDRQRPFYPLMKQTYGDPTKDSAELVTVSTIRDAGKISVPIMIAHGAQDRRVDIQQAADMIEALKESKKNYLAIFREDEGHGFHRFLNYRDYLSELGGFLQTHLPIDDVATKTDAAVSPYLQEYASRNKEADQILKRILERRDGQVPSKRCVRKLGAGRCKK